MQRLRLGQMEPLPVPRQALVAIGLSLASFLQIGCQPKEQPAPSIEFTVVPEARAGQTGRLDPIAGRVKNAQPGQRIVLYAKSGPWWVQPFAANPFTRINRDSTWQSTTHPGDEYAALLVDPGYVPPNTPDSLPREGDRIRAVAIVQGRNQPRPAGPDRSKVTFSGYSWDVTQTPSDSAGVMHPNLPTNVWTDAQGRLHLRLKKIGDDWTAGEVALPRSLGYGTYSFHIAQTLHLEPGTVLGMFVWDPLEAGQNHREIDIELSQWGDPESKNAQFAIQPYYVPANVFRFNYPPGPLTHSFRWEPGRVSLRTVREVPGAAPRTVAEHVFSSGIPTPGNERVHINLYLYGKSRAPQKNGVEVVIDQFAYLP